MLLTNTLSCCSLIRQAYICIHIYEQLLQCIFQRRFGQQFTFKSGLSAICDVTILHLSCAICAIDYCVCDSKINLISIHRSKRWLTHRWKCCNWRRADLICSLVFVADQEMNCASFANAIGKATENSLREKLK